MDLQVEKAQSRPQNRNVPEHPDFRHTDHRENYLPSNQSAQRIIRKRVSLDDEEGESLATIDWLGH